MDLCNLYDFYTFVFTLAFTPCTFNVLFYVRIKYYNNNNYSTVGVRLDFFLKFRTLSLEMPLATNRPPPPHPRQKKLNAKKTPTKHEKE